MFRNARKIYFPPGYIEPRHWHKGWHCVVVMKGRMCVDGKELKPGDYVFGWDELHGPFEYPDGFEGFTVSMGEDMHHVWDEDEFYTYERQWKPETDEAARNSTAGAANRPRLARNPDAGLPRRRRRTRLQRLNNCVEALLQRLDVGALLHLRSRGLLNHARVQ
jgi:hypothetical protein